MGTGADRVRLLASGSPGSGSWLHALPSANIGFRLSDSDLRVSVGLRLGVDLVSRHICECGATVLPNGHHGLSCKQNA